MHISTILFDLDNTIYPTSTGLMHSLTVQITKYVQHLLGTDAEEAFAICRRYFLEHGTTLRGLQHYHAIDVEEFFTRTHDLPLEPFLCADPNLSNLLSQVSAEKVIFSNAPMEHIQRVLAYLEIEHHFQQIFDIRSVKFQPKPEPSSYQHVLDTLGIDGSHAIMIEDTPKNLVTARAFGMTTILVTEQPDLADVEAADYIVPNIHSALVTILELEEARSVPTSIATPISCWPPPFLERWAGLAMPAILR